MPYTQYIRCTPFLDMLDQDYSGKMGFAEFKALWSALNSWKNDFMNYDRDRSGSIEPHELHQGKKDALIRHCKSNYLQVNRGSLLPSYIVEICPFSFSAHLMFQIKVYYENNKKKTFIIN